MRCGATTHTAQLEMRRKPRDAAEQAMRREPQLGAELRRDEKTKTTNENNSYDLRSQLLILVLIDQRSLMFLPSRSKVSSNEFCPSVGLSAILEQSIGLGTGLMFSHAS